MSNNIKLVCTKNLVLGNQLIIMKNDKATVLDISYSEEEDMTYIDLDITQSLFATMEVCINIKELAGHFEYDYSD